VTDATIAGDPEGKTFRREEVALNDSRLPDIGFESYDSMEGLIAIDRTGPPTRFGSWPGGQATSRCLSWPPGRRHDRFWPQRGSRSITRRRSMLFALLFGMAFHFLHEEGRCVAGIEFYNRESVLRLGVGLLGVRITLRPDRLPRAVAGCDGDRRRCDDDPVRIPPGPPLGPVFNVWRPFRAARVAICGASAALAIASVLPRSETRRAATPSSPWSAVTALVDHRDDHLPESSATVDRPQPQARPASSSVVRFHDVAQVVGAGLQRFRMKTGDHRDLRQTVCVSPMLVAGRVRNLVSFMREAAKARVHGRTLADVFWSAFRRPRRAQFHGFLLPKAAIDLANDVFALVPGCGDRRARHEDFVSRRCSRSAGARIGLMIAETLWIAALVLFCSQNDHLTFCAPSRPP